MAARKNRGTKDTGLPQEWKDKCRAAYIANRFLKCFDGEVELTQAQLKAGEILFKRLEPELSRVDGETTLTTLDANGKKTGLTINVYGVAPGGHPNT